MVNGSVHSTSKRASFGKRRCKLSCLSGAFQPE